MGEGWLDVEDGDSTSVKEYISNPSAFPLSFRFDSFEIKILAFKIRKQRGCHKLKFGRRCLKDLKATNK